MFDPHTDTQRSEQESSGSNWRTSAANTDMTMAAPAPQQPAPAPASAIPHQLRRHSVTVGEMHFHSFDNKNQHQYHFNHNELDHILASFPSSWSSTSSSSMASSFNQHQQQQRHPSLFDNSHTAASPTPAFFSPSFLDALKHEDNNPFQAFPPIAANTTPTTAAAVQHTVNTSEDMMLQDFIIPTTANTGTAQAVLPSLQSSFYTFNGASNDDWPFSQQQQRNKPNSPTSILSSNTTAFYHPSIPEEDALVKAEDLHQEGYASTDLDTTLPITPLESSEDVKPFIQHYLSSFENERKITILTSKVAQKSYGTEKRFLCPPPLTILSGSSPWFVHGKEPKIQVQIKGENQSIQNGIIDWQPSEASDQNTRMTGTCVAKHLHINDSTVNNSGSNDDDKRKRVQIQVNIQLGAAKEDAGEELGINRHLGTFFSRGIKVISKPSKKRQSVKNLELCIHHGSIISLFNRIRSQTVSTKYLGVSMETERNGDGGNDTCFVARTNKWDPFVIWLVDLSRSTSNDSNSPTQVQNSTNHNFPPPPAIALRQLDEQDPIAIHYNQAVVLQCVNTGLVSPIMVIRKVDKGSQVLGGNAILSNSTGPQGINTLAAGGECGDEALGDPVSQLHKIAFQIVTDPSLATQYSYEYHSQLQQQILPMSEWNLPHLSESQSTYLACLEDVVGMHKTTSERYFVTTLQQQQQQYLMNQQEKEQASLNRMAAAANANSNLVATHSGRRRRVSCDVTTLGNSGSPLVSSSNSNPLQFHHHPYDHYRRRVNSLNDGTLLSTSVSANNLPTSSGVSRGAGRQYHRRNSTALSTTGASTANTTPAVATNTNTSMNPSPDKSYLNNGACWTEDVSDASIWTIVGTDCITYKFCTPDTTVDHNNVCCTPFPMLTSYTCAVIDSNNSNNKKHLITLHGENFTKDLSIWFGDIQSPSIEYKSKETIICTIPSRPELQYSLACLNQGDDGYKIPLLFIRNSVIYNTDQFYQFQ